MVRAARRGRAGAPGSWRSRAWGWPATAAWPSWRRGGAGPVWWWAVAAGWAVLLGGLAARRRGPERAGVVVVLVAGALFRVVLVPTPPVLSDDLYRYLWDGRVQAAGISPYRYAPAAPELAPLRDDLVWPGINRKPVRTIYPPLAQAVFAVTWRLGCGRRRRGRRWSWPPTSRRPSSSPPSWPPSARTGATSWPTPGTPWPCWTWARRAISRVWSSWRWRWPGWRGRAAATGRWGCGSGSRQR